MDPTIIAAFIGGGCVIAASIITLILSRRLDNKSMYIDHERREALKGQWKGSARQEIGPDGNPIDYTVTSRVTATSHVIQAEAQLHFQMQGQKYTEHLQITGGFLHDRFLKLEYKISDRPGSIQFGLMILELDPSGRTLSGHFLSYGAESQHIVSGTIQLQKDVQ